LLLLLDNFLVTRSIQYFLNRDGCHSNRPRLGDGVSYSGNAGNGSLFRLVF
jgi:hypothetical protein